jgi:hypothetical protein
MLPRFGLTIHAQPPFGADPLGQPGVAARRRLISRQPCCATLFSVGLSAGSDYIRIAAIRGSVDFFVMLPVASALALQR